MSTSCCLDVMGWDELDLIFMPCGGGGGGLVGFVFPIIKAINKNSGNQSYKKKNHARKVKQQ